MIFAYSLPGRQGHNPLWAGMGYPGHGPGPAADAQDADVITPSGDTTLEADVVVVGSGSGGGVAAAVLAQAGKRVIILEAGGYFNESDFVQLEPLAYQNLFLRGGFFPSADGMVSIAAGSTVGGGSTVNWSNSLLTPATVRRSWAADGLTDVDTPAFDEHLQAVFDRINCNDKVATQNAPHQRLAAGAAKLGYSYRVAMLNIDPDRYDPNLIGWSGWAINRRQAGHAAHLSTGRVGRRSETAAQHPRRADPHQERRSRRRRGDLHRPSRRSSSSASSSTLPRSWPPPAPWRPCASPPVGYRWARRRRRTATCIPPASSPASMTTPGPVVRPRDGRHRERVRRGE